MQRIIIILLAILIALPIVIRSRERPVKSAAPAVFSVISSPNTVHVMISGNVKHSGLYLVDANTLTAVAIKMAGISGLDYQIIPDSCSLRSVLPGDHLQLVSADNGTGVIKCGNMSARQRILVGIPLDINAMTTDDFESLPGIGPVMAQKIVEYRQNNGGKMKHEDLLFVEGIGERKFEAIAKYF